MHSDTKAQLAQALRLIADALEQAPASPSSDDAPMTLDEVIQRRTAVTPGWIAAHVAACGRGARQRKLYRLSDVDRALTSAPVLPRTRKCAADDPDPIDEAIAAGELVRR